MFKHASAIALVLASAFACTSAEAVQRTFVASYGSDANTASNCGFANPCRSFSAALTITDTSGEVVALDAAGYGPVTINNSVTITSNPGFYAGIAASSGNAVTIAASGVVVVLRGLNINGAGAAYGVNMTSGAHLTIENCVISNFNIGGNPAAAVYVNGPSASPINVRISDSVIRGNRDGILVKGATTLDVSRSRVTGNQAGITVSGDVDGTTTRGSISDTIAAGNFGGFVVETLSGTSGNAYLAITRSTVSGGSGGVIASKSGGNVVSLIISNSLVTGNATTGMSNVNAIFESLGNNTVRYNGTDTFGTITTVGAL